jgi:hypothetical protein
MSPGLRAAALPLLVAAPLAAPAQATPGRRAEAPAPATPPPIEDNSFLVDEAYNQDRGVVQHVGTFDRPLRGPGWLATFTQEWPLGGRRHQLSYTAAALLPDAAGAAPRPGDLALNYRMQVHETGGVLFAPRATVVLPTGSARASAGAGGVGLQANLPLTLELTPHWSTHTNAGGTLVPSGRDAGGAPTRAANVTLAQSVIWLATPTFNVLVESLWSRTSTRVRAPTNTRAAGEPGDVERDVVVSPGVRFAVNRPSGMQIVPGLAAPLALTGPLGRVHADPRLFLYLSVEHPFGRTR